ncbi:glycosyltransferase family 4 protein [Adhaeretor mobilis]|uniref:D-inositol 3-phosphate glycosyltransferase n=1 Tax=Adhaeretor mobilis TaxID=1930276 RepID=A0A517MVT7_9BACT|nr:glycosyltransferase family 4 protein [Adhaeretor mobilis]QDS98993.1 D-inositol 3-phosphate glycosyltransferase [Adhaeretor mobilis]
MTQRTPSSKRTRPRVLLLTYHYDRAASMESRLSWRRAQHAAEDYDTTVICAEGEQSDRLDSIQISGEPPIEVIPIPLNKLERFVMRLPWGFYLAYRLWHRRVLKRISRVHSQQPFSLVHHVSFCGYREPSDGWRLGVPFIWGPIGGTHNFPGRFLSQVHFMGGAREIARNALNSWQLRHSRLVKKALNSADMVAVASESARTALSGLADHTPQVLLETGVDPVSVRRTPRDTAKPLKILWSGRLQCWKALPLLLRAMAELPLDCCVQVRVMGEGPRLAAWQKLAEQLTVADRIQWIGWPNYQWQLPQYQWADVFAFTSLRDTSGTGLLEALAAGTPIIGLDHQGAADIMNLECAVPVPVTNPKRTITAIRDAIVDLSTDPSKLAELSRGAVVRAKKYTWEGQRVAMKAIYATALQAAGSTGQAPAEDEQEAQELSSREVPSVNESHEGKPARGVLVGR